MLIFMAVMITDILLLDFFNTLGMPTSTTVSIVFNLLGAAVVMSLIKISHSESETFADLGSYINTRFGILKGLVIGGIAMASSNILFSVIAHVGPNTDLFAVAVIIDGFTGAFATVAFVSFITQLTSRTYTATQYALMASLGNLGKTVVASGSGVMVDWLDGDWSLFFIITALMVLPSIVLLLWMRKNYRHIFK